MSTTDPAVQDVSNGTGPPAPRVPEGGSILRWMAFVGILGFVAGIVGLLVGLGVAVLLVVRPASARRLFPVAIVLLLLVPVVVLLHGLPSAFFVSPDFVRKDLLAHDMAFAGIALLLVAIFRSVGAPAPPDTAAPPDAEETSEAPPSDLVPPLRRRMRSRLAGRVRSSSFGIVVGAMAFVDFLLRVAVSKGASPDPVTTRIVESLVNGGGFGISNGFRIVPTALRMPGVPALLALTQTTANPQVLARFLWALMGAVTVVAVGIAARRFLGKAPGYIAAALVALLPSFWLDAVRLTSGVVAAMLVALLLVVIAPAPERTVRPGRTLAAGLLAGALALTRPEGLIVGVAILGAWLAGGLLEGETPRARGLAALIALVAVVAVIVPWTARTHAEFGTALPSTLVGTVAAGANTGSAYTGRFIGSFDPAAVEQATAGASSGQAILGEAGLDRALRSEARSFAFQHPLQLVVVLPVRLARTFDLWNPVAERDGHAARGLAVKGWLVQWASFVPMLLLAVLGYRLLWRRRAELLPLYAGPAAVALVGVIAYGEPLMRSQIDPILAMVAAWPLAALAGMVQGGRGRNRPPPDARSEDGGPNDLHDEVVPGRSARWGHRPMSLLTWPFRKSRRRHRRRANRG